MSDDPTKDTGLDGDRDAGKAPFDPTDITPDVDAEKMRSGAETAAAAAGEQGDDTASPIGGEATLAATSWDGIADTESDEGA